MNFLVKLSIPIVLAVLTVTSLRPSANCTLDPKQQTGTAASTEGVSGATGRRFLGEKYRDFPANRKVDLGSQTNASLREKRKPSCDKWVVVTTIYEPSEAMNVVVNNLTPREDWCLVVVADTKTPMEEYSSIASKEDSNVVFLTVEKQQQLAREIAFLDYMPFQSFARKNVGYLYAIIHAPKVILDLDDDNILILETGGEQEQTKFDQFTQDEEILLKTFGVERGYQHNVVNPFPVMGASVPDTWPRGFPLSLVKSPETAGKLEDNHEPIPISKVGVIQSVCNQDPDVDAVYRLTRPLPFDFSNHVDTLAIPGNLYTPYNAQATLHYPNAYWGMYLPFTVTGRVSDIWRSYIVQRLMRELVPRVHLLYSPPFVTQVRNAHDYIGDMAAEDHLYMRTEALLEFLDSWRAPEDAVNLPARIQDLWIQLYERRYVELEDVVAIQEWLQALQRAGYSFPGVRRLQRES